MFRDSTGTYPLLENRTIEQLMHKYSYSKPAECTHHCLAPDNLKMVLDLSRKDYHAKTRKQLTYNCDEKTPSLQFHV